MANADRQLNGGHLERREFTGETETRARGDSREMTAAPPLVLSPSR